jgi:excisionase family DNA binding protein
LTDRVVTIGRVNTTSSPLAWPDVMLAPYGEMLTVTEVAAVLNVDARNVRGLLKTADTSRRLPGVKIGKSWRIARSQLTSYLVDHQNQPSDPGKDGATS